MGKRPTTPGPGQYKANDNLKDKVNQLQGVKSGNSVFVSKTTREKKKKKPEPGVGQYESDLFTIEKEAEKKKYQKTKTGEDLSVAFCSNTDRFMKKGNKET